MKTFPWTYGPYLWGFCSTHGYYKTPRDRVHRPTGRFSKIDKTTKFLPTERITHRAPAKFFARGPAGVPEGPPKGVRTTGRVGMGWYQELSLRVSMLVKACLNPFSQISDFLDFHIPPTPPLQLSPWHWCESTKFCMSFCQNPKYSAFFYEMFGGRARVHRNPENQKSAKMA